MASRQADPDSAHPINECVLKEVKELERGTGTTLRLFDFCRVHAALRITSAMARGITDHVWGLGELLV